MRPLVVIPTYNEAENIVEVVDLVRGVVPEASVLVVDDNSPDGTGDLVDGIDDPSVHLLRRPGKAGLGTAYRAGFAWGLARDFDVLVEMDADLSHDPDDLPRLLAGTATNGLTIGSRYVPGGSIPDWSWYRKALSRWGNRYAGAILRLDVRDATAGYRAYTADTLRSIALDEVRADGYGFQIEMAYRVAQAGAVIDEVPIAFTDRTKGTSKMSSRIIVEALALVTWWGFRDRIRRRTPASG